MSFTQFPYFSEDIEVFSATLFFTIRLRTFTISVLLNSYEETQHVHSSFSRYDKRMYGSSWTQISESLQLYLVNKKNCKLFLCVKKI